MPRHGYDKGLSEEETAKKAEVEEVELRNPIDIRKHKLLPLALLEALPRLRSLEVVGGVEEVGHRWTVEREPDR